MLSLDKRDTAFGNKAAWDFIATELIGENDHKAVLHFLKGETRPLVFLGTESIQIGSNGAKELLSLLHNTFLGFGDMPSLMKMCPRTRTSSLQKEHFFGLPSDLQYLV